MDILKTSQISVIANKQGDGDGGEPQRDPQKALMLAPQAEGGTWTEKADMPTARMELSASVVDGIIYAIGGEARWGGNAPLSTVEAYDPATDNWTPKAGMLTARSWSNTAVVDGKIYAIGGDTSGNNQGSSVVEEYNPATDTWERKTNMQAAKGNMATCVLDGKVYVIGGYHGPAVSTTEVYDPSSDTWTKKANMPTARWGGVAASTKDGLIYVIGGETTFGTLSRAVEVYDPAKDTWEKKADIPQWAGTLWSSGKAAVVDGRFYTSTLRTGEVVSYDPVKDTWRKKPAMLKPRRNSSFAAANDNIYVIGGMPLGTGPGLATVEQFTPDLDASATPQGKLPTTWGEVKSK
ncbi:Kelch repeat-containing protein [Candidatus Poribacteria bacterium]